jgi:predicted nucleotidyltransferase
MPFSLVANLAGELKPVCDANHVKRLRVFGSVSRGEQRPDSDVDILVDYEPGYVPTLFTMENLQQQLSQLFDGRQIDLMRPQDVHWFIRKSVLSSAQVLYER